MSINDMLDSNVVLPAMGIIFIIIMIIAIPAGLSRAKSTNEQIYGTVNTAQNIQITVKKNVLLKSKRTEAHPLNQSVKICYALFELENGARLELAIQDINAFSLMAEGDIGTLKYQGQKFIGYER